MSIRGLVGGLGLGLLASLPVSAANFEILYSFPEFSHGDLQGRIPLSLVRGNDGSFYGVMESFGGGDAGAIFRLAPPAPGQTQWQSSTLFEFPYFATATQPGGYPLPNLVIDSSGSIFGGTTGEISTGHHSSSSLYRLSPPTVTGQPWAISVLYPQKINSSKTTGLSPFYVDNHDNIFGLAYFGQTSTFAQPFALSRTPHLSVLPTNAVDLSFRCDGFPNLILGQDGSFYGTTDTTVYRLPRPAAGETVRKPENIYVDANGGLCSPIIADRSLDIYSDDSSGNVYELFPPVDAHGTWRKSVLYTFSAPSYLQTIASPLINWKGVLYGVAIAGAPNYFGKLFHLAAQSAGNPATPWVAQIVHTFVGGPNDGSLTSDFNYANFPPALVPVAQPDGTLALYGVTCGGGANGSGVFFRLII